MIDIPSLLTNLKGMKLSRVKIKCDSAPLPSSLPIPWGEGMCFCGPASELQTGRRPLHAVAFSPSMNLKVGLRCSAACEQQSRRRGNAALPSSGSWVQCAKTMFPRSLSMNRRRTGRLACPAKFMGAMGENVFRRNLSASDRGRARERGRINPNARANVTLYPLPQQALGGIGSGNRVDS